VAGDAVEERAEEPARAEAHVLDGVVAEELQHRELVPGEPRHAPREAHRVRLQAVVGHRSRG
jgi:hypothetical protein